MAAEVLQEVLGHSTIDLTTHYARLAGSDLAREHQNADPVKSLKARL